MHRPLALLALWSTLGAPHLSFAKPSLDLKDSDALVDAARAALTKLAGMAQPATDDGALLKPWWASAPAYDTFLELSKWSGKVDSELDSEAIQGLALMSHGKAQDFLAGESPYSERWNDDICWGAIAIQNGVDCFGAETVMEGTDGGKWGAVGPKTVDEVWDYRTDACGGGLKWSRSPDTNVPGYTYKSVITNLDFIILSCRVFLMNSDKDLLDHAKEIWEWLIGDIGLITSDGKVYDGLGSEDCSSLSEWQWSYNAGQAIQAAAWLSTATDDQGYLRTASAILKNAREEFGQVVMENCPNDSCSTDAVNFKGIFVRALPYLYRVTQDDEDKALIEKIIKSSVEAMIENTCTDDWLCGAQWDTADNGGQEVAVVDQIVSSALLVAATGVFTADGSTDLQPDVDTKKRRRSLTERHLTAKPLH